MQREEFRRIVADAVNASLKDKSSTVAAPPQAQLDPLIDAIADGIFAGLDVRDEARQHEVVADIVAAHGRIDAVRCLGCGAVTPRADLQRALAERNPGWAALRADIAPDGDADLDGHDFATFDVPVQPGGRTGLFDQPEAQVLGKTIAWLVDHSWRETPYGWGDDVELDPLLAEYLATFELAPRALSLITI